MNEHVRTLYRGSIFGTIIIGVVVICIRTPIVLIFPGILILFYLLGLLTNLMVPLLFWTVESYGLTPEEYKKIVHSSDFQDGEYNIKFKRKVNYYKKEEFYTTYISPNGEFKSVQWNNGDNFNKVKNFKNELKFNLDTKKLIG